MLKFSLGLVLIFLLVIGCNKTNEKTETLLGKPNNIYSNGRYMGTIIACKYACGNYCFRSYFDTCIKDVQLSGWLYGKDGLWSCSNPECVKRFKKEN